MKKLVLDPPDQPVPENPSQQANLSVTAATPTPGSNATLSSVPIKAIKPNPYQPREQIEQDSLTELANSIKANGLIQPIVLRRLQSTNQQNKNTQSYELVAGERRWRAAQIAGLDHIPAIIHDLADHETAEWALIENLQREDLNPLDRAQAFRRLLEQFNLSHEQIATRVGVNRSTITNTIRLLSLNPDVQMLIRENLLSFGQAKAIAGLSNQDQQLKLADRAVRGQWSVRQLETTVRLLSGNQSLDGDDSTPDLQTINPRRSHLTDVEKQIGMNLQTKVRVRPGRKKGTGTLTIEFYNLDQFDALLARMGIQLEE